jgi:putative membrane protein
MMEDQQAAKMEYPFDPRRLVLRWLISTLAIFAAVWAIPGIHFAGPGWQLGIIALLFGLLSALLRPLIMFLSLVTLGLLGLVLFGLVINALLLVITAEMARPLHIAFQIHNFWSAFLGGLVISIVSMVLSMLAGDNRVVIKVQRDGEDSWPPDRDDQP